MTTVHMRETKSEYGMRCKAAGNAKEKASKNIMRRCFQNTGRRSTYNSSPIVVAGCFLECCLLLRLAVLPNISPAQAVTLLRLPMLGYV